LWYTFNGAAGLAGRKTGKEKGYEKANGDPQQILIRNSHQA